MHSGMFPIGPSIFYTVCEVSFLSDEVNRLTLPVQHLLFWLLCHGEKTGWSPAKLIRNIMSFLFLKA